MEMMVTNNNNRIRVNFDDDGVLTKTQVKLGLKQSWVLLKPSFTTIDDIITHLTHSFQLHKTCPRGIVLAIDDFILPPFESLAILKDTDVICVKRRRSKLQVVFEDATQQPLPSGIKLLTHKEHDEETESYQSDTDEDDDKRKKTVLPLENSSGCDVASKKRKAFGEIESLKTKKQRQLTPKSAQKKHDNSCEHTPRQKIKANNTSVEDTKAKSEVIKKCSKKLKSAASESKEETNEKQEEKTAPVSQSCDGTKKVCRATRRKKLKRMLKRMNREKENTDKFEGKQPAKAPNADPGPSKCGPTNIIESQKDGESDTGGDLVRVEIRPGHIRFGASDKVKDVQQSEATNSQDVRPTDNTAWGDHLVKSNGWHARANKASKDKFEWNGISNKRKGQKQSATSWDPPKDINDSSPNQTRQFGWKGTPNKKFGGKNQGKTPQQQSSWKNSRDNNTVWGNKEKQPFSSWKNSGDDNLWGKDKEPPSSWKNSGDNNGWGKEKQASSSWKNPRDYNAQSSGAAGKRSGNVALDFEKLVPLTDLPKVGDVYAYRLLELSSTLCPELSSFRIGKVAKFELEKNEIVLVPDPLYPLNIEKKTDSNNNGDDDSGKLPVSSMYDEDGNLQIDFPSLVDVRIIKRADIFQPGTSQTTPANGTTPSDTTKKVDETQVGNGELETPTPVNGKKDVWEEISEALSAKQAQLSQEDPWKKKVNPSSSNRSWSNRNLRGSGIGPTMARLRAQNGL